MMTSPALARVPSARTASRPGTAAKRASRSARACSLSSRTVSRLAARSRLDLPAATSARQASNAWSVGGSGVPDVDASLREVVLERGRVAAPDAERRRRLVGVGEAVEFGEADRRPQGGALLGQVAEDAARGDRGQLLVVSDQADAAASLERHGRRRRRGPWFPPFPPRR